LSTELPNVKKKSLSVRQSSVLPAAAVIVEPELEDSHSKEVLKIHLADNTVRRRISNISEGLCDQLIDHRKTSRIALQIDEAIKDAHLIYYVRYMLENYTKDDFLFLKPLRGRPMSLEVFSIINHSVEENGRTALDSAMTKPSKKESHS
jgi:hypothetical protein